MKYYCIGIKGSGMSTLAQILYDLGNEVSGYDDSTERKFCRYMASTHHTDGTIISLLFSNCIFTERR